jgi:glycosyltransferase involved in cell wall biosynthesis
MTADALTQDSAGPALADSPAAEDNETCGNDLPGPREMANDQKPPRVSVGLPIYNGEKFLDGVIGSILSQSFRDIELLISDNASTDRTGEICREYAARDSRVRYHRNPQNVGLISNHNLLFGRARGEFFMWIGHDDALDKDYLARCVELLDRHSEAILCFADTRTIGRDGQPVVQEANPRRIPLSALETDSADPRVRYRSIIQLHHMCTPLYGVVRANLMGQTRLQGKYADADRVYLAELAVRGRFLMIHEPLFFHGEHEQRSVYAYPSRQERTVLMDPTKAGKITFPYWRELLELFICVHLSPLPLRKRLACYWETLSWMKDCRALLFSDLQVAAIEVARRTLPASVRQTIKRVFLRSSENS